MMINVLLFIYLPNLVLAALLVAVMWKAGLRGLWLAACLGPLVAGPFRLWLLQFSVTGKWLAIAVRIVLPFEIKWCALFILAFKTWPRAKTEMNRPEFHA